MTRIRPATVTVGVIAILLGLVAAYVVRHAFDRPAAVVQQPPATPAPPETPMAVIVVPTANLPKYTRVGAAEVTTVEVPADAVPEGALQIASQAVGRLVKTTIMAGEPVLDDDLYGVGEVPLLADQLPPGLRAVTLQVDANSALNGMIQPTSTVDVVLTVRANQAATGGLTTLRLLSGVQVVATSQARFPIAEDRPSNLRNITVAVTPAQANQLILAQRFGTLSVTLRSNLEPDQVAASEPEKDMVNPNDLLGFVPQPVPERLIKRVQVWRGGRMEEIAFDVTDGQSIRYTPLPGRMLPTPAAPAASPGSSSPDSECEECKKDQQGTVAPSPAAPGTAILEEPTLAPLPPTTSLAGGGSFQTGSQGQVIYVPVEAGGSSDLADRGGLGR